MTKQRYFRPGPNGGSWWPKAPVTPELPLTGGARPWTDGLILDWSTGRYVPRSVAQDYATTKRYDRWPGLRSKPMKSSATHKYHYLGPYNGCKIRKWYKQKGKVDVEYLPDMYTLSPWHGRYEYQAILDMYSWKVT